ncbi:hypothetical protein RCL1_003816 [Eukaryota sp. TZLM3-RCL]
MRLIICCFLLIALAFSAPILRYSLNQEFHYNLESNVAVSPVDDKKSYTGSTGRLRGTFAMKVTDIIGTPGTATAKYYFVCNVFDALAHVSDSNDAGAPLSHPGPSAFASNDLGANPMGKDMFFQINALGEIEKIVRYTNDDDRLVRIKVGLINSFHTSLVDSGKTKTVLESDPVGVHYSAVKGSGAAGVTVSKTFTQKDFKSFTDPKVSPNMVSFDGNGAVTLSSAGYFTFTSVKHNVVILKAAGVKGAENSGDVSVNFQSKGLLTMVLSKGPITSPKNELSFDVPMISRLVDNGTLSVSTMFDLTAELLYVDSPKPSEIDPNEVPFMIYSAAKDSENTLVRLEKLIHELSTTENSKDLLAAVTKTIYGASSDNSDDVASVGLYVLAATPTVAAGNEFAKFVAFVPLQDKAVSIAINAKIVTSSLVNNLLALVSSEDETIAYNAHLALGSLAMKASDSDRVLITNTLLKSIDNNKIPMEICLAAFGNAGEAIPLSKISSILTTSIKSSDAAVRAQVIYALRKRQSGQNSDLIHELIASGLNDVEERVVVTARDVAMKLYGKLPNFTPVLADSLMPFNYSWEVTKAYGGSTAGLDAKVELFAGSNLNCKQPTFNYEALARAQVNVHLFDASHSAAMAEAVYGKVAMKPLADKILVTVWDNVVYTKPLGAYDCKEYVRDLLQYAPGVSYKWVFFISVIPVEVSVSASLKLDVHWSWSVCDGDLSAIVSVLPEATIVISGRAEINLLVVAAGVELAGSVNSMVIPSAYAKGSLCTVGINARLRTKPMAVDVNAYWKLHTCFLWFFDCKLKDQHTHNVFHWAMNPVDTILYQKEWKIV